MNWPKECTISDDELHMVRAIAERWHREHRNDDTLSQASFDIGFLIGIISRLTGGHLFESTESDSA